MAILIDPVAIEPMRRADMEAVFVVDRRCFTVPWMASAFLVELSNRSASYLVARQNQVVIGFGGIWLLGDEIHITTLAVDPDHQGRKVGERILIALLEEGILQGATRASLEVRVSNLGAQNLYRKYGFHETGINADYYPDNNENALVMCAGDINTPGYQQKLRELRRQLYKTYEERLRR